MDFTTDRIASGRRFRTFSVIDVFTREALGIYVDTSIPGAIVVKELKRIGERHGFPNLITSDNGPEFTGAILDKW